jgi:hypothetical protein
MSRTASRDAASQPMAVTSDAASASAPVQPRMLLSSSSSASMAPPSPLSRRPGTDVEMTSKSPSRSSGLALSTSPATENPAHTPAKTEKIA